MEGLTRYTLLYEPSGPLSGEILAPLMALRDRLRERGWIGVDEKGIGQGNASLRLEGKENGDGIAAPDSPLFAISGTGTGAAPHLSEEGYSLVLSVDPDSFTLRARGPAAPSSEAVTHGALYRLSPSVRCVIHIHHLPLWNFLLERGYPATKTALYGSREMVKEVLALFRDSRAMVKNSDPGETKRYGDGIFSRNPIVMKNHRGGILSFGRTSEEAEEVLLAVEEERLRDRKG